MTSSHLPQKECILKRKRRAHKITHSKETYQALQQPFLQALALSEKGKEKNHRKI